jgi:hypothetical protein
MPMRAVGLITLILALTVPPAAAAGELAGIVVTRDGVPLADVVVTAGSSRTTTGDDGRFRLTASGSSLRFERLGYSTRDVGWGGGSPVLVEMAPMIVRGIHVAGWVPSDPARYQNMLDIGAATSVNALVIDVKDESGRVYHESEVAAVAELGAGYPTPFDLSGRVAVAHSQGFHVIARVVAFQDPVAARARPVWAAIDSTDGLPLTRNGQYFLDPTDLGARRYALDIAVEACRAGADEIQFDYIRFPDGGLAGVEFDGPSDEEGRRLAIKTFLAEARASLQPLGCVTAADIFGWITHTRGDGGIGQNLEDVASVVDVVSPMVYPSHYSPGWYGFAVPNDHPGPVVTNASRDALERVAGSSTLLRPWLQDFWYTAGQVEAQITSVDALGLGWMLWNVRSEFTVAGIPRDGLLAANAAVPPVIEGLPGSGFFDVADTDPFAGEVSWLRAASITAGCNPPWNDFFCPEQPVTRGQMAAFLARALGYRPVVGDPFWDDDGSVFEADIEALAAAGVTRGCNPPHNTRFCPEQPVTRGQMAAFLARALG